MKEEILQLMKKQLQHIANEMTYDNYQEMQRQTHRVFTILESSETMMESDVHQSAVPATEEQVVYPPLISQILQEEETESFEDLLDDEEDEVIEMDDVYRFERRIRGGWITAIDAFVPERIIRDMDLSHGDKVRAKFRFKPSGGPARYDYELVEKAQPPESPPGIVEINMGIVSYEPNLGGYAIGKTIYAEELLHEGEPVVIPIAPDDAATLNLKEGDIVNAAYYFNNVEFCRLRWKYTIEEVEQEQAAPKPSSFYKKKNDEDDDSEVDPIFNGRVIACMGYEPGWAAFREEIEKRGGEFYGLTGRESESTLAATLKKADCLVMVLAHVGHTGTKFANAFCKEHGIPYDNMKNFGRTTFVNTAANLL